MGVPYTEACAAVLARAVARRVWLSQPFGEPPSFSDIDAEAAGTLIDSVLERQPVGGRLDPEQLEELLARHGVPLTDVETVPELSEADLNTIRCTTHGGSVLDARLRIEPLHPIEKIKTW